MCRARVLLGGPRQINQYITWQWRKIFLLASLRTEGRMKDLRVLGTLANLFIHVLVSIFANPQAESCVSCSLGEFLEFVQTAESRQPKTQGMGSWNLRVLFFSRPSLVFKKQLCCSGGTTGFRLGRSEFASDTTTSLLIT